MPQDQPATNSGDAGQMRNGQRDHGGHGPEHHDHSGRHHWMIAEQPSFGQKVRPHEDRQHGDDIRLQVQALQNECRYAKEKIGRKNDKEKFPAPRRHRLRPRKPARLLEKPEGGWQQATDWEQQTDSHCNGSGISC